jgi:predicted dienelactone hydrolase
VLAAALLLAGCGDGDSEPTASTVETTSGEATIERYEVESSVETFVDDTRVTPANGSFEGAPSRTIETKIYRPVVPEGAEVGDGFPLIVFSHGIDDDYERYEAVLREWAASGYVVAAPNFPLSRKGAPGGPTLADLDNQPADLQFVMDGVRRLSDDPGHELADLVADETALAGKSFGAITTLTAVYGPEPVEGPVDAVVSMAGGMNDTTGVERADSPLLLIHGDTDERVPYQSSVDVFAVANPPKYFLTLIDEGHTGAYNGGDSPVEVLVPQASLDFFDAYLKGDDAALERLNSDYDVPAVATLDAVPG